MGRAFGPGGYPPNRAMPVARTCLPDQSRHGRPFGRRAHFKNTYIAQLLAVLLTAGMAAPPGSPVFPRPATRREI